MKGLPWEEDGRLKAPEEDAGVGVWGAKLRRKGVLVILESVPSISSIDSIFSASTCLTVSNEAFAAVHRFLRQACSHTFPATNGEADAEEDTKHTKGGLNLLT